MERSQEVKDTESNDENEHYQYEEDSEESEPQEGNEELQSQEEHKESEEEDDDDEETIQEHEEDEKHEEQIDMESNSEVIGQDVGQAKTYLLETVINKAGSFTDFCYLLKILGQTSF